MSKLIISDDRQYLSNRSRSLPKRKRHSQRTIHVTIRPCSNVPTINNRSISTKKSSSMKSRSNDTFVTHSSITKSICLQNLPENTWPNKVQDHQKLDRKGAIQDHHRMRKAKKNYRRNLLLCLFFILSGIIFATVITLIILLTKPVKPRSIAYLRWNTSGITVAGKAGVTGANSTLLYNPYGLAFDSSKTLYIADQYNNRIQKLLEGTNTCVTVAGQTNGSVGNNSNQLNAPVDILFDANDNMYISDRKNARIQFWLKGATSGVTVAGGSSNISLNFATGIVGDPNSEVVFIADTRAQRVVSYPAGQVLAGGHGAGNNITQLSDPFGLAYDSFTNSFIIPCCSTNNIVRWVLGATSRTHIAGDINGIPGNGSTSLNNPIGLILDPMVGQTNATTIAGTTGISGTNSTQLNQPF